MATKHSLKFILLSVAAQINCINFIWGDMEGGLQYFTAFFLTVS